MLPDGTPGTPQPTTHDNGRNARSGYASSCQLAPLALAARCWFLLGQVLEVVIRVRRQQAHHSGLIMLQDPLLLLLPPLPLLLLLWWLPLGLRLLLMLLPLLSSHTLPVLLALVVLQLRLGSRLDGSSVATARPSGWQQHAVLALLQKVDHFCQPGVERLGGAHGVCRYSKVSAAHICLLMKHAKV